MPFIKIKTQSHKTKRKPLKDYEKFYNTTEWGKIKSLCISQCFGIDVYSFYVYGRIEYGQTVHHIKPVADYPELKSDINNLIYLTESNHQIIHHQMESGNIPELRQYLEKFQAEFMPGGYMRNFNNTQ